MEDWLSMPKVELHAHLNGSVRDSTLLELASVLGEKGVIVFSDVEHVIRKNDRSLTEVFRLFDLIHILTTDHKVITRITKENNASIGMSKHSYLEAVLEGIKAVTAVDVAFRPHSSDIGSQKNSSLINHTCSGSARKKIYVRLLLSIDRRETTEAAMETVKLALEMRDFGVVGIDLSGNPIVGEWYLITILSLLQKTVSFNPTVVPNPKEIQAMLYFQPQRIGHACCFEEEESKTLKSLSIPVEICLTSNIRTNTIPSLDVHHFADLYNAKHPLVICTDDSGVFSTCLSNEFNLAATVFGLGKRERFQLAINSIDLVFADDGVKRELKEIVNSAERKLDL